MSEKIYDLSGRSFQLADVDLIKLTVRLLKMFLMYV